MDNMENQIQTEIVLSEELVSNEPPVELLIIKYGETKTTKGDYRFDEKSAGILLNTYLSRGLKLYFDYSHLSIKPENEEQAKAAGWFDLELRQDGLYAINIKWTAKAEGMIRAKEFAYISPVIGLDKEGFVIRLINIALTNLPATSNLPPLIKLDELELEHSANVFVGEKESTKIAKEDVRLELGETMKKEEAIKSLVQSRKYLKGYAVHASKCMADSEDMEMMKMYTEHHGKAMEMVEHVKSNMKRLDFDPGEPDGDESMTELTESIAEITGKDSIKDQIVVLTVYKNAMESIKALNENIAVLTEDKEKLEKEVLKLNERFVEDEKARLIEDAINGNDKKLIPKQKKWALTQSIESLKMFLEATPVLNIAGEKMEQPVVSSLVELSEIGSKEEEVLKELEKTGIKIDRAQYLKDKKNKLGIL